MLTRLGGASAIVAGLVLAPLTSTAAAPTLSAVVDAQAAGDCVYTPGSVTLKGKPIGLKFEVPEATDWAVKVPDLGVDAGPGHRVKTFQRKAFENADAGLHEATVEKDGASCTSSFRLLRGSLVTLLVTHKHPYRFVGGAVMRYNFGPGGGQSTMAGARVVIQRKSKSGWINVKTLTTNKKGIFVTRIKTRKRIWRAYFDPTSTTGGTVSKVVRTETEYQGAS